MTDLERLARAATPGPWQVNRLGYNTPYVVSNFVEPSVGAAYYSENAEYIAALSPERVLAMIAVIDAAQAMRVDPTYRSGYLQEFDAALAALEKEK
jgi:hypothetical protein